MDGYIWFSV